MEIIFARIDWTGPADDRKDDIRLVQSTDDSIRVLYAHLRYVEAAQTHRVPWSILPAFEHMVGDLLPGIRVMLRPQWRYNYTCIVTDLHDEYLQMLAEHQDFQPDVSLEEDVLEALPARFHIVGFPSLERTNILLHCLLGHEIGHLLASEFVTEARQTEFVTNILPELELLAQEHLAARADTGPLFRKQEQKDLVNEYATLCKQVFVRGLDELFSDLVGTLLFGPAALFSTLEMGLQEGYDEPPSRKNEWYPPWRYRLRTVLGALNAVTPTGETFFPVHADLFTTPDAGAKASRVNARADLIQGLVAVTNDKTVLEANHVTRFCYRNMERAVAEATVHLLDQKGLRTRTVTPQLLYRTLPSLIERLEHRVPPNATAETTDGAQPASLAEIINAAWFHRLSWVERPLESDGTVSEALLAKRRANNNLTMKAIEFADLTRRYEDALPKARGPHS